MTTRNLPEPATKRKTDNTAAERKRRQRALKASAHEVKFLREEWGLFLDPNRLPQKAGCPRDRLRQMALKELVDNALDASAAATLAQDRTNHNTWIVSDDGAGLDRARVLEF